MQNTGPKYNLIVDWVLDGIGGGEFKGGDKLPSENELAEKFDMSRQTVRHAISTLEREGRVYKIKGSGTYLCGKSAEKREARYQNIAVVSTYMDSYIFPSVFRGIESVLSPAGYTMQIFLTGNHIMKEEAILKDLIEKDNIDGLIIEPARSALPCVYSGLYSELAEMGIPILFFNCKRKGLNIPLVAMDDFEIGRKAAKHLIKNGHKNFGGIFKCDDFQGYLRFSGFYSEVTEAELNFNGRHIIWTDTDGMENLSSWSDYLFERLEGCTGIFCYNDELAYKLEEECLRREISVPGDISLVGVDHHLPLVLANGEITSFQYPMESLGIKAAENMLKLIDNSNFDANFLFHPDIVELGSVKKI